MGINAMFGDRVISDTTQVFRNRVGTAAVLLFRSLGESLVKYAKDHHNYTDDTGNLTNSIGYVVVHNKKIVSYGGATQGEGYENGLKVAMKMAMEADSEFSLIIVAGMNYAAYVEAKGYNVILPAELKAKSDFPEAMKKLIDMAKAKASEIYGAN